MYEIKYKNSNAKIILACILFLAFSLGQETFGAVVSDKTKEVKRNVISNPTAQTIDLFVAQMLKEYKKQRKNNNYEEAADCLRSALYFLAKNKNSKDYAFAIEKYGELASIMELDLSDENTLEIAKNLYLEKKYFASAYEFSNLLEKKYKADVCYEYLGDIAEKIDSKDTAFKLYGQALNSNPQNLSAKLKFAKYILKSKNTGVARVYFEDIIEKTNSNDTIDEIISIYTKELDENPNDENNYGILGLAYQKIGQYDRTYKLLRKSIIINPNDIFLRYYLGNLLYNINEFGFANEIYSDILEDNPYESQIRISRAKAYITLQNEADAIKDYQIVLAMYPDSMQAQYGLYSILKDKMPLEDVIKKFFPLKDNFELDDEGFIKLGVFSNKLGKIDDAVVFFKKSVSMNTNSPTPYIELYKIYQIQEKNNEAKEILDEGYKKFPKNKGIIDLYSAQNSDNIDKKNTVALSYINDGDYEKAIQAYDKIEPKTDETYLAIANCYRQLGSIDNAIENYNNSIQINPDNSEVLYALGAAHLEKNNLADAKKAFQSSLEKNPKNIKSKKMLSFIEQKEIIGNLDIAYSYFDKKEYAKALEQLNKGVEMYPDDPKVFYYRALTKEAMGDNRGAVDDLKQVIKIDRNYVAAYYKLGENLEKINKKKEALYMYEKYLGAQNQDSTLLKTAQERVIELGEQYY